MYSKYVYIYICMNDRWYVVFVCYAKLSSRVLSSLSKITTFWKPKKSRFLGQKPEILFGKTVCHYGIAHIKWRIVLGSPKSRDAWVVVGEKNVWNNGHFKPSNVKTRPVRPCWGQIPRTWIRVGLIKNWLAWNPMKNWTLPIYLYIYIYIHRVPICYPNENGKGKHLCCLRTCGMVLSFELPQLNQTTLRCCSCGFFPVPRNEVV